MFSSCLRQKRPAWKSWWMRFPTCPMLSNGAQHSCQKPESQMIELWNGWAASWAYDMISIILPIGIWWYEYTIYGYKNIYIFVRTFLAEQLAWMSAHELQPAFGALALISRAVSKIVCKTQHFKGRTPKQAPNGAEWHCIVQHSAPDEFWWLTRASNAKRPRESVWCASWAVVVCWSSQRRTPTNGSPLRRPRAARMQAFWFNVCRTWQANSKPTMILRRMDW